MTTVKIINIRQPGGSRYFRCMAPFLMTLLLTGCWESRPKEIEQLDKLGWSVTVVTNLVTVKKPGCTDTDLATLSEYAQKLKEQKKAMIVNLSDSKITDAGLANIKSLINISELNLSNTGVTSKGVAAVAGLANLKNLKLKNTKVDDDALSHLSKLEHLNTLELDGCLLTGAGFESLRDLANLETLSLNDTRVDDAGLAKLLPLPKLKYIFLDKTQITVDSLSQLKKFSGLRELSLKEIAGTIDPETQTKFKDDNPDLQVDF